jgi:hypothetical protein
MPVSPESPRPMSPDRGIVLRRPGTDHEPLVETHCLLCAARTATNEAAESSDDAAAVCVTCLALPPDILRAERERAMVRILAADVTARLAEKTRSRPQKS